MKKGRKFGAIPLLSSVLWCMLLNLGLVFWREEQVQVRFSFAMYFQESELVFVHAQRTAGMTALLLQGHLFSYSGQVACTCSPKLPFKAYMCSFDVMIVPPYEVQPEAG